MLLYDGNIFIETSVGDAYPKNILITAFDGVTSNGEIDFVTGIKNRNVIL